MVQRKGNTKWYFTICLQPNGISVLVLHAVPVALSEINNPATHPALLLPAMYGWSVADMQKAAGFATWRIYPHDVFKKATARSSIRILGANGPIVLPIPVKKHAKGTLTSAIEIDYIQKWQNQHWRSLQSAYGKAPYFEYFKTELEYLFHQKPALLVDFTVPILKWIHSQYFPKGTCTVILAQETLNLQPCDELPLSAEQDKAMETKPWKYMQVFGKEFVPGLSVLDALFCAGPYFPGDKLF